MTTALVSTFEGYAIHGKLAGAVAVVPEEATPGGPTCEEVDGLAEFCRENLVAMLYGATPSYYLPGAYDAGVHGAVISVHVPGHEEAIDCSHFSLRPEVPLQATLVDMCRAAAEALRSAGFREEQLARLTCGLTVLWAPAMHGSTLEPDLAGVDPRRCALLVTERAKWALAYDPQQPVDALLGEAVERARVSAGAKAAIYSLAAASNEARLVTASAAPPSSPEVRPAAVAGRFYPGNRAEMDRMLDEMIPSAPSERRAWAAALVPHAGWAYSGRLAAATLCRAEIPSRVLVVCPKHRPEGESWAVAPYGAWAVPGAEVRGDPELAQQLADRVSGLKLDAEAHRLEHAIEVQLPILARLAPECRVVGIAIHGGDLGQLERFAEELAGVVRSLPERPLLVISSDMNHFADDEETRRLDRLALDAVESLDPARLYRTVREHRISMCGVLPAVLVLQTLHQLGAIHRCEPVQYATSAETSGDLKRVVGYAGMLFE